MHILKPKSEFSRNILTLMTGSSIAQAIPIAISPILTRIYTPENFGVFALFVSITSVISVVASGRYEMAIVLPTRDEDAIHIMVLSIIISFIISSLLLVFVLYFNTTLTILFNNPEISYWLYLSPITVLMTGVYQSFTYWNTRKKHYKNIATVTITQSATTSTIHLFMGLGRYGSSGLILGSILGQGLATVLLARITLNNLVNSNTNIKISRIISLAKRYVGFPTSNSVHSLLNVFSTQLPVFLISYLFNASSAGFYALSNRVLISPFSIITSSFGNVFFQKMSSLYKQPGTKEVKLFKITTLKVLLYSFPFFAVLFVYAKDIFSIVFGNNWEIAGVYAQILIPMLYLRLTGSIISSVVLIYDQQTKALIIEIIHTIFRAISLVIGGLLDNIVVGLILFSTFSSIVTLYRIFWYFRLAKGTNR